MVVNNSPVFQVHPEGKFVVDVDKNIDINDVSICWALLDLLGVKGVFSSLDILILYKLFFPLGSETFPL